MLRKADSYDALLANFRWHIPRQFNIATVCCDLWAAHAGEKTAINHVDADGAVDRWTYQRLNAQVNRLANGFQALGIGVSDRIGILLPQCPQTIASHLASYKLGAIAVPLSVLFGPDALSYRLKDAGVRLLVTNAQNLEKIIPLLDELPALLHVICLQDGQTFTQAPPQLHERILDYHALLDRASPELTTYPAHADDPALMIYTSGTTGMPKGVLHGHRVLLGHLPGVQMAHNFMPEPGDCFWTPADWAWAGGLLNAVLPALYFGVPLVSFSSGKFDPERALHLIKNHNVRNVFMPPTALKMLRGIPSSLRDYTAHLRSIATAGETLGAETYLWAQKELGMTINDAYGQTECNLVLGSCAGMGLNKPGAIGRVVPGHAVAILDPSNHPVPAGKTGEIAIHAPDPVMFLSYWQHPEATAQKFTGKDQQWFKTGDQGMMDEDGFVHFLGRNDDMIISSGYRIGPVEIEECLLQHPSVLMAAVVGEPDALRTEIIKAYIVLRSEHQPSTELENQIKTFVRTRLAHHAYPRKIAFVKTLPMTVSGKIIRKALREKNNISDLLSHINLR